MPTCWSRKGTRKNRRYGVLVVVAVLLLTGMLLAQIYLPPAPAPPAMYGRVVLDSHAARSPGPVVFDHWLHRSKFTCRLCHVDVGFAMTANGTGITQESIRQGYHCGACHNGKLVVEGNVVFAACQGDQYVPACDRCHGAVKRGVRRYDYQSFTAKLPKNNFGVDWMSAEERGLIRPADELAGFVSDRPKMPVRNDFDITAGVNWVRPVQFSHQKHAVWNGCELCHPEIFATAKKSEVQYTMFSNIEGHHCGACHLKVAFPLNNCAMCHARAPMWAQQ